MSERTLSMASSCFSPATLPSARRNFLAIMWPKDPAPCTITNFLVDFEQASAKESITSRLTVQSWSL